MEFQNKPSFRLVCVVILINVLQCNTLSCHSYKNYHNINSRCQDHDLPYSDHISCTNLGISSSNLSSFNFTYEIINSKDGIIKVFFNWPLNDYFLSNDYLISLDFNYPVNRIECNPNAMDIHSCKKMSTDICGPKNCANCTWRIEVQFTHIFTGCYQLRIDQISYQSNLNYIVTDFTKSAVMTENVTFDFKYADNYELSLKMVYPFIPSSSVVTLLTNSDPPAHPHSCNLNGEAVYECVICLDGEEVQCLPTTQTSVAEMNKTFPVCQYRGQNGFECKFFDLKPMNYCVNVEFEDDRCDPFSIWYIYKNGCNWMMNHEAEASPIIGPSTAGPVSSHTYTGKFVIISCGLIIMLVVIAIVFIFYKLKSNTSQITKVNSNPNEENLLTSSPDDQMPQVVLVYARDCPEFMDVMVQFRKVLMGSGFQVHDCWDIKQQNKIQESKPQWVQQFLIDEDVCFIFVRTIISDMMEESYFNKNLPKLNYKEPRNFDELYINILDSLLNRVSVDEAYTRIYVCSLDLKDATKSESILNPKRVYILPTNLDLLVTSITKKNESGKSFITNITTLSNTPDVEKLKLFINNFKRINPDYINDLLDVKSIQPKNSEVIRIF
uniref:Uncharacterized protein n=3 Tax=Clastoptera arizonana TaxID=38151 RepID=A0A1B6D2G9_9HEMI